MSEVITAITEIERECRWGTEAGFEIQTNRQTILLMIDNDASCCEHWGYLMSEDDLDKFVGARLLGVRITDTNRSSRTFNPYGFEKPEPENNEDLDGGDVMFVDIQTDRGILQFVTYNSHNGYYGHEVRVKSEQLTHSEIL